MNLKKRQSNHSLKRGVETTREKLKKILTTLKPLTQKVAFTRQLVLLNQLIINNNLF